MTPKKNLSYFEYYDKLQREYLLFELRKKIYPSIKDKKYFEKVLSFKKKKILDLSARNQFPSIFSDEQYKNKFYIEFYPKIGFPNFFYRDENDEEIFKEKDFSFYYLEGSEVKFILGEEVKFRIGIIKEKILEEKIVVIEEKDTKELFDIPLEKVSRFI